MRRPAIHQGFYRTIDNGFGELHSTDIGALFFLYIETAAWFAGFMVVSIMLAVIFGKVMRER